MTVKFYKFQATGNDFILLNGFGDGVNLTIEQIRFLCDRHFGVGADGLIILRVDGQSDFFMEFYNPDGSIANFCGNGGRTAVLFAFMQGLIQNSTVFRALDGLHKAQIIGQDKVRLQMNDVTEVLPTEYGLFLNTGTQHVVRFVDDLDKIDIIKIARPIRYAQKFMPEGTNVNFVKVLDKNTIQVRTYEKGVENETLSCGTGTVAAAIAAYEKFDLQLPIMVKTRGGLLKVTFEKNDQVFTNIFLEGPAKFVFWGQINL